MGDFRQHLSFSRSRWLVVAGVVLAGSPGAAQPESTTPFDPEKVAFVSFVNACSTDLAERWRASVDVYFRGIPLCRDLRIGESSLLRQVENDGEGSLEIRRSGTDSILARIPASIRPKTFNTVVVTGSIGSAASAVEAVVLRDFPLPESQQSKDRARLVIVSGIRDYPTKVSIGGQEFANLQPGAVREVFVQPGEKEIKMFFSDKKLGPGEFNTSSGLLAEPGRSYNVFFFDSPSKPGRPRVSVTDVTQLRKDFIDALTAEEEQGSGLESGQDLE
jgi:hypothetical protein